MSLLWIAHLTTMSGVQSWPSTATSCFLALQWVSQVLRKHFNHSFNQISCVEADGHLKPAECWTSRTRIGQHWFRENKSKADQNF